MIVAFAILVFFAVFFWLIIWDIDELCATAAEDTGGEGATAPRGLYGGASTPAGVYDWQKEGDAA